MAGVGDDPFLPQLASQSHGSPGQNPDAPTLSQESGRQSCSPALGQRRAVQPLRVTEGTRCPRLLCASSAPARTDGVAGAALPAAGVSDVRPSAAFK